MLLVIAPFSLYASFKSKRWIIGYSEYNLYRYENRNILLIKILEIMKKVKSYLVSSFHNVFVDDFQEGEQEQVNCYGLSEQVPAKDLKEAILDYVRGFLGYEINLDEAYIDEQGILHYSCLVDNENLAASKHEVKWWRKGAKKLYSNNYSISVEEVKPLKIKL